MRSVPFRATRLVALKCAYIVSINLYHEMDMLLVVKHNSCVGHKTITQTNFSLHISAPNGNSNRSTYLP